MYISKSNKGSQGIGIKLLQSPKDLNLRNSSSISEDLIIQRYISRPLLINKRKHDLRLYVLIASVEPFVAFINEEGLARFCVDEYQNPNSKNKGVNTIHLSNYSVNKNKENFVYTDELSEINEGTKRTLTSYWKSVRQEGHDPDKVPNPTLISKDQARDHQVGAAFPQIDETLFEVLREMHVPPQ